MKAIKRITPLIPFTVIETITAVAHITMMDCTWKRYSREFPASLTVADADKEFKEWADNIDLSHNDDVLAIDIRVKELKNSPVWSY